MAWACMAANGTRSLVFIADLTANKGIRMNSELYGATLCSDSAKCCKTGRFASGLKTYTVKSCPRVSQGKQNEIFFTAQVSHLITTQ